MADIGKIKKKLRKAGYAGIEVSEYNGGVRLTGEAEKYEDVLECGSLAVTKNSRGVINDVKVKGSKPLKIRVSEIEDDKYDGKSPDVLVIGGGIVGAAIARELTKYALSVVLVEKEYDIATGQSARNDGMIHAGIDLKPASNKVKYNCRGNAMYPRLSKELDVPIEMCGQCVLYTARWQKILFPLIKLRGAKNGIPVEKLNAEGVKKYIRDPGIKYGGFMCPSAGILSPYLMTVALAENAAKNGAEIYTDTAVTGIVNDGEKITAVRTNRGTFYPKAVVNAAGVYSDVIAEWAGDRHFTIHPRRGVEAVLDKKARKATSTVIGKFVIKSSTGKGHTKGGGVIVTIDGNLILGPSASETEERENEATTAKEFDEVFLKQQKLAPELKRSDVITYFAGTRAATYEEEFVVEKSPVIKNFVQAAGIQSPGVTAAPAIAEDVARWAAEIVFGGGLKMNENFDPIRKRIPRPAEMEPEARKKLIEENPDYGVVVCRCEEVTKGEIKEALRRPAAVAAVDAVKRRVRAGMGRCQGGFCTPLVMKIISEECGIPLNEVRKKGTGSAIAPRRTKGGER